MATKQRPFSYRRWDKEGIVVSATPTRPEQAPRRYPPGGHPLSESSRRRLARLTGMSVLIAASLTALIAGIVIGNAARKRIDRLSHAGV